MPSIRALIILLVSIAISSGATLAETPVEEAKRLFTRYVDAANAFDSAVADLYSDEAKIENKRIYPDGSNRVSSLTAANYRIAMPLSKARGDTSTFSDVKYAEEGKYVRITATRFSNLKKYSSPFSLLVGPAVDGKWLILEEISESKP